MTRDRALGRLSLLLIFLLGVIFVAACGLWFGASASLLLLHFTSFPPFPVLITLLLLLAASLIVNELRIAKPHRRWLRLFLATAALAVILVWRWYPTGPPLPSSASKPLSSLRQNS